MALILPRYLQCSGGLIRANLTLFGTRPNSVGNQLQLKDLNGHPVSRLVTAPDIYELRPTDPAPVHLQADVGQNLLIRSNQFAQTGWGQNQVIVTESPNQPGPQRLAWLPPTRLSINRSTTTGDSSNLTQTYSATAGLWYTASVYMKADDLTWGYLTASSADPGNSGRWFNLATGQIGSGQASTELSGIEAIGNGWYRVWVASQSLSGTTADQGNSILIIPALADGQGGANSNFPANGQGIYIAAAQLEVSNSPPNGPGIYCQSYSGGYDSPQYSVTEGGLVTFLIALNGTPGDGTIAQMYWSGIGKR